MHTQHLIGRVRQIQADLRSVSDELQLRGHTVTAEELRRDAKSMDGLLLTLRADLAEGRRRDEARSELRDSFVQSEASKARDRLWADGA